MKNQPKTEKRPGGTLIRMPEPEALEEFKKIYEIDSQYRDVADRVESAYQQTA